MQWVTLQAKEAFANVIIAAQAVARDPNSTQEQIDAATSSLVAAQKAFDQSKAAGTHVDEPKSDKAAEPEKQQASDQSVAPAAPVAGNPSSGDGDGSGSAPTGTVTQEEPEQQTAQPAQDAQEQAVASSVRHGVLISPTSIVDNMEDGDGDGANVAEDETGPQGITLEQGLLLGFAGLIVVGVAARAVLFNRSRRQRASA